MLISYFSRKSHYSLRLLSTGSQRVSSIFKESKHLVYFLMDINNDDE